MERLTKNNTGTNVAVEYIEAGDAARRSQAFSSRSRLRDGADCLIVRRDRTGNVTGECALWWSSTPIVAPALHGSMTVKTAAKAGFIGHFSGDASMLVIACDRLRQAGVDLAIGPIDGSTWKRYRLMTESNGEPAFFLEPTNGIAPVRAFETAGFVPVAKYHSSVVQNLSIDQNELRELRAKFLARGVSVRTIRRHDWDAELEGIYATSIISFRNNFLYTPVSQDDFKALYAPLQNLIDPRLVLIAEREGKNVGFCFTLPNLDPFSAPGEAGKLARAGSVPRTAILKTLARLPQRSLSGLGRLLLLETHKASLELGYQRIVHALFKDDNASYGLSTDYAKIFRTYSLFGKELG